MAQILYMVSESFSVDGIAEIPKYFSSFNLLSASKATMFLFLRQYISYL